MGRGGQSIKFGEIILSSETESMDRLMMHLNTLMKKYGYPSDRKLDGDVAESEVKEEESLQEEPKQLYVRQTRRHAPIPDIQSLPVVGDHDADGVPESEEFLGDEALDALEGELDVVPDGVVDNQSTEEVAEEAPLPKWIRGKKK